MPRPHQEDQLALVEDLLLLLFDGPQLTRFIRRGYGAEVADQIPELNISLQQQAHTTALVLERNGLVNEYLFNLMSHERAGQNGKINKVAELILSAPMNFGVEPGKGGEDKYLLYLSRVKLDMLFSQMQTLEKGGRNPPAGADRTPSEMLRLVEQHVMKTARVGEVEGDAPWIEGTTTMRCGTQLGGTSELAVFISALVDGPQNHRIVLFGSRGSVLGSGRASHHTSAVPKLLERLMSLINDTSLPQSERGDRSRLHMECVHLYDSLPRIEVRVKYLARRVANVKGDRDGVTVLATPLYVALAD